MGLIYTKGNSTGEAQLWEMLSRLGRGVCASIKEFSLGTQKGLLLEGFVQQRYLSYRQAPHTNSSEYECSWSPQSNLEITEMKAQVFAARLQKKEPRCCPEQYEVNWAGARATLQCW